MKVNRITIIVLLLPMLGTICGCFVPWQHKKGFQNFIILKKYNDDVGDVINKYLEENNYKLMDEYSNDNKNVKIYKKYLYPLEISEDNGVVAQIRIDINKKYISKVYINIFSIKKGDQELFYNEINMVGDAIYKMSSDIVGNTNVKIKKSRFPEHGI